eukprot:6212335-Pleurochrysis_carterae.AAC.2
MHVEVEVGDEGDVGGPLHGRVPAWARRLVRGKLRGRLKGELRGNWKMGAEKWAENPSENCAGNCVASCAGKSGGKSDLARPLRLSELVARAFRTEEPRAVERPLKFVLTSFTMAASTPGASVDSAVDVPVSAPVKALAVWITAYAAKKATATAAQTECARDLRCNSRGH